MILIITKNALLYLLGGIVVYFIGKMILRIFIVQFFKHYWRKTKRTGRINIVTRASLAEYFKWLQRH
jgi:hypothetical protein